MNTHTSFTFYFFFKTRYHSYVWVSWSK